jgi:hypothetical protein
MSVNTTPSMGKWLGRQRDRKGGMRSSLRLGF